MAGTPEATLRAATARRKRAAKQASNARLVERAAVLDAIDAGVPQVDVCDITGFTRDYVRRLTEAERKARAETVS